MSNFDKELGELTRVIKAIDKKYGKGIVEQAHESSYGLLDRVPTGSFTLDVELGGGIPEDRITLVVGDESTGKTWICLKTIAKLQKKYPERKVLWVDVEGVFDKQWAKNNGVNLENLLVVVPQYAEQALEVVDVTIRTGAISGVVIDSVTALLPGEEMEKSMEDQQIGLQARINNKFFRKVISSMRFVRQRSEGKCAVTVLLIGQIREKIGSYGNPEVIPGGRGMRFYPSVILHLRRGNWLTEKVEGKGEVRVGHQIKFRTTKNKTYTPLRDGEFDFYNGTSSLGFRPGEVDRLKEVVTYGILWDVIIRRGAYYYINEGTEEEQNFQGSESLLNFLRENPDELKKIETRVMEKAYCKVEEEDYEEILKVGPDGELIE